jgi:AGZA family xanthine/uracil permease-like MFS transporter
LLLETALRVAGSNIYTAAPKFGADLYVHGAIALNQGFILNAMVFSAMLAFIIDHEFKKAAFWSLAAAAMSALGLMHAYTLTPAGVQNKFGLMAAPQFVVAYLLTAGTLFVLHARKPTPAVV